MNNLGLIGETVSCAAPVLAGTNNCAQTLRLGTANDGNALEVTAGGGFQYLIRKSQIEDRDGKRYITVPITVGTETGTISFFFQ